MDAAWLTPRRRAWLRWGGAVATLALLALALRAVPWGETRTALRHARGGWLVLAAAANLASLAAKAVAWWWFLGARRRGAGGAALRGTVLGAALNNVMPWNLGDAARLALFSSGTGIPVGAATTAFALERAATGISALLLLTVALPWAPLPWQVAPEARWGLALVLGAVGLVAVRRRASPADLGAGLGLGVLGWLLQFACYDASARAVGLGLPAGATIAVMAACNLGFIVRVTPGGVGVFQVAYVAAATALGVERSLALAAALLVQAVQIVPVLLAGAAWAPQGWRRTDAP